MSVKTEKNGDVFTVILDRPEARNAVGRINAEALSEAFNKFEKDDEARVAVLWGAGGNFCAGADLKALSDPKKINRLEREGDGPMGPTRMKLSKPVIAAISGYAVAGGLELAVWCDMRVVEKSAVFGVFCRRWGVPLIDGGTVRLPRLIGLSRAMDLILTGRPVESDEALLMGLANRVVPDGTSREEAEKLASEIALFPQTCMRHDRLSAMEQFGLDLDGAIINEYEHGVISISDKEMFEGAKDFSGGKGRHGAFDKK
jgi:enoyl-CoA hydratase/carnithine racemase